MTPTIAEISHLPKGKRAVLLRLLQKRAKIIQGLHSIDMQIRRLKLGRKYGARHNGNTRTLHQVLIEVLGENLGGLSMEGLRDAVLAAGYRSSSRDLRGVISGSVALLPGVILNRKTGLYRLR